MKKISRLTALLLALLLIFQMTAVATETSSDDVYVEPTPIPQEELNEEIMTALSNDASAVVAALDTVRGMGVTANAETIYFHKGAYALSEVLASLPKGTYVKVYDSTGISFLGEWYKVNYNGQDGYIHSSFVKLCTCTVETGTGLESHDETCPDKMYYTSVCALTAEEIYAGWASYAEAGQTFILYYLGQNDTTKLAELNELIEGGPDAETKVGNVAIQLFGSIPENVVAEASLYPYDYYSEEVHAQISSYSLIRFAYDISLKNEDGSEWQPGNGEKIRVTIDAETLGLADGTRLGVLHEDDAGNFEKLGIYVVKDGSLTFETGSFSTFYGYTVDFVYNGNMYSIPGGTSITLEEVFAQLGISEWAADQATTVEFSNPELINVYKDEATGGWVLESLVSFSTTEMLTITFDSGAVLKINVYDSVTIATSNNSWSGNFPNGVTVTADVTLTMSGDVTLGKGLVISEGKKLTINGNGHTIKMTGANSEGVTNMFQAEVGASLELNNVILDGGAVWSTYDWNTLYKIEAGRDNSGLDSIRLILFKGGGTFKATSTTFQNAHNTQDTGTIISFMGSTTYEESATFTKCTIKDCQARQGGSGVIQCSGLGSTEAPAKKRSLTVTDTTIQRCADVDTAGYGGIIRTNSNTNISISISGSKFYDNLSNGWGVILWNSKEGTCSISSTTFNNNHSGTRGGAISSEALSLKVTNCEFKKNTAGIIKGYAFGDATKYGGAIAVFPYTLGGAQNDVTVNIVNCKFEENKAPNGGAVAVVTDASENSEAVFKVNTTINLGSGYMKKNSATSNGGAIYVNISDATNAGSTNNVVLESGSFEGNTATNEGGMLYINNEKEGADPQNTTVTMKSGVTIDGSDAVANAANGGAICIKNGKFTMNGGTIQSCVASENGGAVHISGGIVDLQGGTIKNNSAAENGGGVYVDQTSVTFGTGTGSITVSENTAKNGAGFYMNQTGDADHTTTITNGTISNNDASVCGGGIYITGAKGAITVKGGNINGNEAGNGGGIYLINDANLEVDGGYITGNKAVGNKGVTGSTAYNNSTKAGVGGGISVANGASATQTKIQVGGNPIGVYGNTAEFAADDVFASGVNTKLNLPARDDMSINDSTYTATTGWFEDYASGDTAYEANGLVSNPNIKKPERYRTQMANNEATVRAFVNADELSDSGLDRSPNHYANDDNVYVCITLGVINLPNGSLTIQKVFDSEIAEVYKNQIFVFSVTGKTDNEEEISFKVQTQGSDPVTITNLPQGTYTVTEDTNWSWRFDCTASEVISLTASNQAGKVEMKNELVEDQWLDYDISKANTFETVTSQDPVTP